MGMDVLTRARRMLVNRQFNQARRSFYSDSSSRFLVDDLANPYTCPFSPPTCGSARACWAGACTPTGACSSA